MDGITGGSSQSSTPLDLTPKPYTNLRPLVANTLAQILQSGGPAYTTGNILGNTPFIPQAAAGGQGAIQKPPAQQQQQGSGMNPNSIMQMLQMMNQPNGPPRETGATNHVTTGQRNQAEQQLAAAGTGGDTMLAHIGPAEAGILKALGGSGTPNPTTGLPSFANPLFAALQGGMNQQAATAAPSPQGQTMGQQNTSAMFGQLHPAPVQSPVQAQQAHPATQQQNPLLAALQGGGQQAGGGQNFAAPKPAPKPVNSGAVNTPVTGGVTSKAGGQPTAQIVNPNYVAPTPQSLVAPLTGGQNDIISQIQQNATQPNPLTQAASGALTGQLNGTNPVTAAANQQIISTLNGSNLQGNPFLDKAIQAAQQDNTDTFNRVTVPGLLGRFTAAGQQVQGMGSSPFADAAGLAAKDFSNTQSNVDTTMRYQNYANERGLQAGAVNQAQGSQAQQIAAAAQANGLSNDQMSKLVTALQAVSLPQQVQDLGIQRGLAEYQQRMQTLLSVLQTAAGVSSPNVANQSTGSSTGGLTGLIGGVSFAPKF